ncbi:MAG: hypothetical protein H6Q90_1913 [Deltaproteobacteria bacterium]|nr:hypothetical protein [Deltaproteobacteria bacterium]
MVAGAGFAIWLVVLVILGVTLSDRFGRQVTERVGESLQADATIESADLAFVRGRLELAGLKLLRDDLIGRLSLDVAAVRCELAPLGIMLLDRECGELVVRGVRLDVSTFALFKLHHPKRPPIRAQRVVIDDAVLAFSPSALAPSLGRIRITIEHAEAGPTTFKTPLSWLFALRELRATFDLPAGVTVKLTYADGVLGVAGSLFGSTPVALPLALPVVDASEDALAEVKQLVKLGRDLAERLVAQKAQDWLKTKLRAR